MEETDEEEEEKLAARWLPFSADVADAVITMEGTELLDNDDDDVDAEFEEDPGTGW